MEIEEATSTKEDLSACAPSAEPIESVEADTDLQVKHPDYDFSDATLITQCKDVFNNQDCLRGCKWSPDGSCLLTNCEDKVLRLMDLPSELYGKKCWSQNVESLQTLTPSLQVKATGLVYDFDWYPFMSSWDPTTSCFICSSTDCPIHLYDAFTGQIRASYRGYDQFDEVVHAFSVSFSSTGNHIFAGYKNNIKIFELSRPGRDCDIINTKHVGKQKGIISCICDNPDMPKVFAAGSYRRVLGVYTMDGSSLCQLLGQKGGLTQVKFSPNGVRLYSSGRKDSEILCWDLRYPGKTLFTLSRPHSTNQRLYFDLSSDDKFIISGSTDGKVRVWNVLNALGKDVQPEHAFTLHYDCINGVSLHRQLPMLATCSGQRHVPDITSDDEDSKLFTFEHFKEKVDNSLKLWWVGPSSISN